MVDAMKTRKIKIHGKVIEAEVCDTIFSKFRGLMFRRNSKPLIFVFKKPTRQAIHSFFCGTFKAIWINNGKIIDEKVVFPWRFSVKPEEKFTHLIEIPLENDK